MSDNPWLFPLPEVVNPPTICVQMEIPNDQNHIAAFLGMMERLATWFRWQRDDEHTGLAASDVWKLIFYDVAQQIFLGGNCPPDNPIAGGGVDTEMAIRQSPDNPCILQSSLDGITWCDWADLSKCMNFGTQPGSGTTPPAAGGGTQQTCAKLNANGTLLLPALVNTGDTITLDNASGAGWDGGEFDFGPLWREPNGDQFVGGLDVGFPTTQSGDPLPTAYHMKLIAGVGATPIYLDLPLNTPVTIPAGVSNAQIWVQVNDDPIGNNQGSYDVCVTLKNNQTAPWCFDRNLALTPGAWHTADFGSGLVVSPWSAGSGFTEAQATATPHHYVAAGAQIEIPATDLTDLLMYYNVVPGAADDTPTQPGIFIVFNDTDVVAAINWNARASGSGLVLPWHGFSAGVTKIQLFVGASVSNTAYSDGTAAITAVHICGTGPQPPL